MVSDAPVSSPAVPVAGSSQQGSALSSPPVLPAAEGPGCADPDLPQLAKDQTNWSPSMAVLEWMRACREAALSAEQIKELKDSFVPDPLHRDLFSPIRASKRLTDAMKAKASKAADTFLFDRFECEKRLYESQQLLGLSLCPIVEALSTMLTVPGAGPARALVGRGLMGVSSAFHKVTHARRELFRKFVRLDVAPYLYSFPPSASQLFGGESLQAQVKLATQASKDDQQFIFKPSAKSAKSSQSSSGFRGKGSGQSQTGSRSKNSGKGRGRSRSRKGKGKGKRQSKSPAKSANADD